MNMILYLYIIIEYIEYIIIPFLEKVTVKVICVLTETPCATI